MYKQFLTNEEANLIDKVTAKLKMDWFCLVGNEDDGYIVKDLEGDNYMTVREALEQAEEGFTDLEGFGFTESEIEMLYGLIEKESVYLDEITAAIGEWLSLNTSDIPTEAVQKLQEIYDICAEKL